jgi:uncharacterized protein DUF3105
MTQTQPSEQRQTSRQRRMEEQRRRLADYHREQRNKRLMIGGAIVLAVVVVIVAVYFLLPKPVAAQGHQVPIEGNRQHQPQTSAIPYRNRPPSSGDHYDQPANYGVSTQEIPTGNWVHSLEHGGIVVLYRPDLCDAACQAVLRDTYNSAPTSQLFPGYRKMVVTPYTDMDHAVATVAWGWLDEMDAPDKDRILAFYRAHVDRGPEQAL